jgi:hypothetical protein
MQNQQEVRVLSIEKAFLMARLQEEMRGMDISCRQHELTRLRIERNRAARHARCAIMRNALFQNSYF